MIALILVGVCVVVAAGLAIGLPSRPRPEAQRDEDLRLVEREVYDRLYGQRSGTVSVATSGASPPLTWLGWLESTLNSTPLARPRGSYISRAVMDRRFL